MVRRVSDACCGGADIIKYETDYSNSSAAYCCCSSTTVLQQQYYSILLHCYSLLLPCSSLAALLLLSYRSAFEATRCP
jgi:hypothetical protein